MYLNDEYTHENSMKLDTSTGTWHSTFSELITGRAHRVHPGDVTRPLGERFAGQTILLVMLAKEKAATVRVQFDEAGRARIGETRQIAGRGQGELARVLQAEARFTGARWAMAVFALGWQSVLGVRSSRPGPDGAPFDRFRLPLEQPELFCGYPQNDSFYSTVDHPTLDRSVVFSLKRKDVEEVLQDFRSANLSTASIRIGVAAQLESWLAAQDTDPTGQDILVTDGLSVLLLQVDHGDFKAPPGSLPGSDGRPRQASARPGETIADITRFLHDRVGGAVNFLGNAELVSTVQVHQGQTPSEIKRAPDGPWHDAITAVLADGVLHDFNPDLRPERQPLSQAWRKYILAGLGTAAILLAVIGINLWQIVRADFARESHVEETARQRLRGELADNALSGIQIERNRAQRLRQWISHNYHAQALAHDALRRLPTEISLDRLSARLEEGNAQMTLEFTLLGDEGAQITATRALERAVIEQSLQIGERHPATAVPGGTMHRWRLLLPGGDWDDSGGGAKPRSENEQLWAKDNPNTGIQSSGSKIGPLIKQKG